MRLSIPPRPAGLGARIFQLNNIRSTRRFVAVEIEFEKQTDLPQRKRNELAKKNKNPDFSGVTFPYSIFNNQFVSRDMLPGRGVLLEQRK